MQYYFQRKIKTLQNAQRFIDIIVYIYKRQHILMAFVKLKRKYPLHLA